MTSDKFAHLCLSRWPFSIVPKREYCTYIADRAQLDTDISNLLTTLSRRDTSSIHIFWAWFGAGKTHTLFYLSNKATEIGEKNVDSIFFIIYSEFPKSVRNFVDIYRSFIHELDIDTITEAFLEIFTVKNSDELIKTLKRSSLDLYSALYVLATGERQNQVIAMRWLNAETIPISELRRIGVSQKISSAEVASHIITALINLFIASAKIKGYLSGRVIWILDEFQRIDNASKRILDEINTGLHSIFNSNPNGLSLFFSFSGAPGQELPSWFSRELQDRIGMTKVIVLPPMLPGEALTFVKDVLAHTRPDGFNHSSPYYPFSKAACEVVIDEIEKKGDIKPRSIMKAFSDVLEEADLQIESGDMEIIEPEFVKKVLEERIVLIEKSEG